MEKKFYYVLYEELYKSGYHNNMLLSHTHKLYDVLLNHIKPNKEIKILDVGCSNGKAVYDLINLGYDAYGIDVSETAIEMCEKRGLSTCKLSSATDIEFEDGFFDVIISSDVMEHILPSDIDKTIKEFKRVNKGICILSIACDEEGNKVPLENLKKTTEEFKNLKSLHTTIMDPESWDKIFSENGYEKLKTINYNNFDYEVIYKPI